MTGKQQAMIAERLKDTKAHNWEIIQRAGYSTSSKQVMAQQYLENMKNPEIASKLNDVIDEMETVLTTTVRRYKDSDKLAEVTLANDNAKWIHDKVKGKATQKIEATSVSLQFGMDLTASFDENPTSV